MCAIISKYSATSAAARQRLVLDLLMPVFLGQSSFSEQEAGLTSVSLLPDLQPLFINGP